MSDNHLSENRYILETINRGLITLCTVVFLVILIYAWGKLSQLEIIYNSTKWQQLVITSIQNIDKRLGVLERKEQVSIEESYPPKQGTK